MSPRFPGTHLIRPPYLAALLAIALCTGFPTAAAAEDTPAAGALAHQIAGTYFVEYSGLPPQFPVVKGLITIHRDGTVVADHNFRNATGPWDLTTQLGAWTITNPASRQGRIRFLVFELLANVEFDTQRAVVDVTFHRDFTGFTGDFHVQLLFPGQDPLDPAEPPFFEVMAKVVARRVLP